MILQILVWCFGRGNCLRAIRSTRRLLTKPFYYGEEKLRMCEDDRNGYPHALSQAKSQDFLEMFDD